MQCNCPCFLLFLMLIISLMLSLSILNIQKNINTQLKSMHTQLSITNAKIFQIQQKINFLNQNYQIKQTKQKQKQNSLQKQHKSTFTDLLNKIISINKNIQKKINQQNDKQMSLKNKIMQINEKIQKLSNQTIQQKSLQKQLQQQLQKIQQSQQQQDKSIDNNSNITINNLQLNFLTSQQFSHNFIINKNTIKRSKFTYQFQPLISSQPLPSQGIHQLSIRIKSTLKGWLYFGIISTSSPSPQSSNQPLTPFNQLFHPSLHQSVQFTGYSGYSGRIWQSSIIKSQHKSLSNYDIIKLRINMNKQQHQQIIQYFVNNQKQGKSEIICKKQNNKQCRVVIEMYNENDQIQFLKEININIHTQNINKKMEKQNQQIEEIL